MKVQVDEITPVKKSLTIEIPEEVVSKAFTEAYSELNRRIRMPGFRPGKVPVSLLEKKYGPSVADDILRKLVPDYYQKAVEETGIFPVEFPTFDKIEAKKGAPLSFTATIEVKPLITLSDYKGMVLPQGEDIVVAEADVDKVLARHQEQHGQLEVCPDMHEIASMDFAILHFEGSLAGKPVKDGKQEGYMVHVGSNTFPAPFESELIGKKKGDVFDLSVPYPEDFQNKTVAGKQVDFHIEVQEVKKKVVPALDDEFAQDLGHETLDELKQKTREDLLNEAKAKQEQGQKKALVDQLIKSTPFEVPSALVARELSGILGSFPDQNALGENSEKKDAFMRELEPLARHRVAETLILNEIAAKEAIEVGDEEIEQEMEAIAQRRGITLKEVKRAFYQKEGALDGLRIQIQEHKALELVYSQARFEAVVEKKDDAEEGEKS